MKWWRTHSAGGAAVAGSGGGGGATKAATIADAGVTRMIEARRRRAAAEFEAKLFANKLTYLASEVTLRTRHSANMASKLATRARSPRRAPSTFTIVEARGEIAAAREATRDKAAADRALNETRRAEAGAALSARKNAAREAVMAENRELLSLRTAQVSGPHVMCCDVM